jgi:hypothetical protein
MRILIKFPTRGRREPFFSALDKYYSLAGNTDLLEVQVTIDSDDIEMNNPECLERLRGYKNLIYTLGSSSSKIHAVNRDLKMTGWDILLLASDDMIPIVQGYDEIIRQKMRTHYPDTDGVLWFNDGNRGDLNTLCILGKRYYDRFGYIYFPEYRSMYCDYEFMLVGNILKRQTYFPEVIIRHEHPEYGYGELDATYKANNIPYNDDMKLFHKRKLMNFGFDPFWKAQLMGIFYEIKYRLYTLKRSFSPGRA